MQLIPKTGVIYKRVFHPGGKAFPVDPKDKGKLLGLGRIVEDDEPEIPAPQPPPKRAGRPKKAGGGK